MPDGDVVTQKDFYETMGKFEGRISKKFTKVLSGISDLSREVGETKSTIEGMDRRLESCENDVKELEKADRKMVAVAATISATLSTGFAALMDKLQRGG